MIGLNNFIDLKSQYFILKIMKKTILKIVVLFFIFHYQANAQSTSKLNTKKMPKTEQDWKKQLSQKDFHILREKGTEAPNSGIYNIHAENGVYHCKGCNEPLFKSDNKFDSHCGWPSFDDAIKGKVRYTKDSSHGMIRTEITCSNCGGHLGHIFDDGPRETTGKRYCVNSASLSFENKKE